MNEPDFAGVAALAGEPARAAMLCLLFDGRAIPAGELASAAGISAATASVHLNKLVEGGLLCVHKQGRHRYYQLARGEIAQMLEALGSIAKPRPVQSLGESMRAQRLRFARTCYNHLAGEFALRLVQAFIRVGALEVDEDGFRLCRSAREFFLPAGFDTARLFHDPCPHVRACIDWTERRRHVSGPLGSALLQSLLSLNVVQRDRERRVLRLCRDGLAILSDTLGITVTMDEKLAS